MKLDRRVKAGTAAALLMVALLITGRGEVFAGGVRTFRNTPRARGNQSDPVQIERLRREFLLAEQLLESLSEVERNRVRRLIREYFRLHRQELPPVDLFVTAREGAKAATNAEIRASLQRLCQEISTKP